MNIIPFTEKTTGKTLSLTLSLILSFMTGWRRNFSAFLGGAGFVFTLCFILPFAHADQAQHTSSAGQRVDKRIVNGLTTFDQSAAAAVISPPPGAVFISVPVCSGVFIGCDTVLSAAHCFCFDPADPDNPAAVGATCQQGGPFLQPAAELAVAAQNETIIDVASIHIPQNYEFGVAGDIAVLKLARPVDGITPARINTAQRPPLGTRGTIVGYGVTREGASDSGIKRSGQIVTNACITSPFQIPDSEHLCWNYTTPAGVAGADSSTCPGDSGGPLFIDFGAGPVVAGVTSGGSSNCESNNSLWDTDVFVNRAFIEAAAGADINSTSCGVLSQVGTTDTTVIARTDSFDGSGEKAGEENFYTVAVPPGTSLMRVVLNGELGVPQVGLANDFDLYVRVGVPPTVDEANCRPFLAGNFEACEFVNPIPGTWHMMVRRFQGVSGAYQLTTTLFDQNLTPGPGETRIGNISTNGIADANGITAGVIVAGSGELRLLFTGESAVARRTIGDAFLELIDFESGTVIKSNDNWQDDDSAAEVAAGIGREPGNPNDAAFAFTVSAGAYLVKLSDVNGFGGRGLVGVTEAPGQDGTAYLANISTNGIADENGIIGGFIVNGSSAKRLIYTGESAVAGRTLGNAYLELVDFFTGSVLRANDNWASDPSADEVVAGIGRQPGSASDAAFAHSVPPGPYLLRLRDTSTAIGRGLVGVTEAP